MTDNEIREYLDKGGNLFSVRKIDFYRDGGSVLVELSNKNIYYITNDYKYVCKTYPPKEENQINGDTLLIKYLKHRIESFVSTMEDNLSRYKTVLKELP